MNTLLARVVTAFVAFGIAVWLSACCCNKPPCCPTPAGQGDCGAESTVFVKLVVMNKYAQPVVVTPVATDDVNTDRPLDPLSKSLIKDQSQDFMASNPNVDRIVLTVKAGDDTNGANTLSTITVGKGVKIVRVTIDYDPSSDTYTQAVTTAQYGSRREGRTRVRLAAADV